MEEKKFTSKPLLDQDGHLLEEGYSFSSYKTLPKGGRKKESYLLLSELFALEIVLGEENSLSLYLGDHEYHSSWKKEPYLKIEEAGKNKKISGLFPNFAQDGAALHFDLSFQSKDDCLFEVALHTEKDGYYFAHHENGLKANGYLKFKDNLIDAKTCVAYFEENEGQTNKLFQAKCFGKAKEKDISFILSKGDFKEDELSPNAAFLGEKSFKLAQMDFENSFSEQGEVEPLKRWRLSSADSSLELYFYPTGFFRRKEGNFFHKKRIQFLPGYFEGYLILDGEKIYLEHQLGYLKNQF